ncbi:alpha-galactosidase [Sulfitobacter geojensis]|uniref:alpha-galactosidase n=1 Tax=Sulfitobacter geojensis TaxID=1342299 RepID=UPI0007DA4521|nr:alpha-galactosidase [Sulfitobacter geojensis]OAN89989.1 alpha-galactosidase [Sulfitobacter geojensis]
MKTWRLDGQSQTLAFGSMADGCPAVIYWGAPLPLDEDLVALAGTTQLDVTGGMLDATPALSLTPEVSRSFPGQAGMVLRAADGTPVLPKLTLSNVEQVKDQLRFTCTDGAQGLTYIAQVALDVTTQMLTLTASLLSEFPVHLQWLAAPVLPAPQAASEMLDFSGRWCGEFQQQRTPWSAGIRQRESRTGRTGHEHFPALIVPCTGTANTHGDAYAFHYGWSGGHRMIAEELPDGRRQIQFGNASDTEVAPATRFDTAPLYATFSAHGLNGCAAAFQRHLRDRIITWAKPETPRPVHYNCWEAVYFDHDIPKLQDIATRAAALGAERFVLDDGWFGKRDDDTTSLGDWTVDLRKYPQGLGPLIDHVHATGMTFGIWFEPEMINPDSDLFRAHPDWVLGDTDQILGRQQKVLNMALSAVRDYLFDAIAAILAAYAVDYIKWDHNRVLPTPDAAQARGTYDLLARLRAAFPQVEIESCASGGGRIDFGILEHTQRVWLSDSNDALERLKIQHNAALFLPLAVTGSHVGPRKCHTSGRTLDIELRAWVAAQRHMGFEMDPRELDSREQQVLRDVTTWWKANRDWMARADILRLDAADPSVIAEQQLAEDGNRFVVFAGQTTPSTQIAPRPLRLTRLDPTARYQISLRNRASASHLSRAAHLLKDGPVTLSGSALMQSGVTLPWRFPETMWVLEGTRL